MGSVCNLFLEIVDDVLLNFELFSVVSLAFNLFLLDIYVSHSFRLVFGL